MTMAVPTLPRPGLCRLSRLEFTRWRAPGHRSAARGADQPGALRLTQVGLLIASLGAVLVVFDPFGLGVVGIFLAIGGAVLAAPGGLGQGWYFAVAGGAIGVALSRLIAESHELCGRLAGGDRRADHSDRRHARLSGQKRPRLAAARCRARFWSSSLRRWGSPARAAGSRSPRPVLTLNSTSDPSIGPWAGRRVGRRRVVAGRDRLAEVEPEPGCAASSGRYSLPTVSTTFMSRGGR